MEVRYYSTESGRSAPFEFLMNLKDEIAAASILTDIDALRRYGMKAPIRWRPIKGNQNRPMREIITGGYRTMFVAIGEVFWILEICKKQDQISAFEVAAKRMKQLLKEAK